MSDKKEVCGEIEVLAPGEWENAEGPPDWFALADDDGVFAYFVSEALAEAGCAALRRE